MKTVDIILEEIKRQGAEYDGPYIVEPNPDGTGQYDKPERFVIDGTAEDRGPDGRWKKARR